MSIDLRDTLRRRKPERRLAQLMARNSGELLGVDDFAPSGRALLMPDTNVYIRAAGGTLPASVRNLIERALLFHCSVCLAELATGVANAGVPVLTADRTQFDLIQQLAPEGQFIHF